MKDLGLAPNDIESLQKMEWAKLIAAGNAAVAKINPPGPPVMGPGAPGKPRAGWFSCVDGKVINMRSFFDAALEIFKNVPMLVGSVTEEGNRMSSRPAEEEWHSNLAKAARIHEAPVPLHLPQGSITKKPENDADFFNTHGPKRSLSSVGPALRG